MALQAVASTRMTGDWGPAWPHSPTSHLHASLPTVVTLSGPEGELQGPGFCSSLHAVAPAAACTRSEPIVEGQTTSQAHATPGSSLAKWRNTTSRKTKLSVPVGVRQCTEVYLMACGGLGVCLRGCWKAHSCCSHNREGTVANSGTPLSIEV